MYQSALNREIDLPRQESPDSTEQGGHVKACHSFNLSRNHFASYL